MGIPFLGGTTPPLYQAGYTLHRYTKPHKS